MPRWEPPPNPPPGPPAAAGGGPPLPAAALPGPYGRPQTGNNATASLVCGVAGIVTLCLCFPASPILGIAAIVLGSRASRAIRASPGVETGAGVATAGVVTGWIALVLSVLLIVMIVAVIWLGIAGSQQHVFFRSFCTGNGC